MQKVGSCVQHLQQQLLMGLDMPATFSITPKL
jgi:hypothetical protein